VYNIPDFSKTIPLNFSASIIGRIYRGNLTRWNDPELQELNPSITLPDKDISGICVMSSRGGLPAATTLYLSTVDKEWDEKVGYQTGLNWQAAWPNAKYIQSSSPGKWGERNCGFHVGTLAS